MSTKHTMEPLTLEKEHIPIVAHCVAGYPVITAHGQPGAPYSRRNIEASEWLQRSVDAYNATHAAGINPKAVKGIRNEAQALLDEFSWMDGPEGWREACQRLGAALKA